MPVTAASIEGRSVTPPLAPQAEVLVQVTRKGHGKVATGVHNNTFGDELYADGETFSVAQNIADELEDRGFVVRVKDEPKTTKSVKVDVKTDE